MFLCVSSILYTWEEKVLFSYIKGKLTEVWGEKAVVESGGIGWNIHVPLSVLDRLPKIGQEVKIYTSFQVREDAMTLYGFFSRQDQTMFEQLLSVNGIGPKAALGILSVLTPDALRLAIVAEDVKAITKAPGIGPKTAKRLILDLKDRIDAKEQLIAAFGAPIEGQTESQCINGMSQEAAEALVALGYSTSEAARAVAKVEMQEGMTVEDILKASLKHLI